MQKLFRSLIAIGGLAGLVACGDDVSVTAPPPPDLTISGAPVTAVAVGAKVQLSANQAVTWSSSNTTVASVDGTGLVTANAAGTASITATATADVSKKASVTITVSAAQVPQVRNVTVSPASATIAEKATLQLVANVDADPGVARTVTWSSSNTTVASVSASGVVTANTAGTAAITATSTVNTSVSGAMALTVTAPQQATISIKEIRVGGPGAGGQINLDAIVGQIEVALNVDPGDQQVDKVQVLIDGVVVAEETAGRVISADGEAAADVAPVLREQVLNINTASYDRTTGKAKFKNGFRVLSARLLMKDGTTKNATRSENLTFRNTSGSFTKVTTAGGKKGVNPAQQLEYVSGSYSVSVLPVLYGDVTEPFADQVLSSVTIAFNGGGCDANVGVSGVGTRSQTITSPTGSTYNATFPTSGPGTAAANNVAEIEFSNPGCPLTLGEPPFITFTGPNGLITTGLPSAAFGSLNSPYLPANSRFEPDPAIAIRLDNVAPSQPNIALYNWLLGGRLNFWVNEDFDFTRRTTQNPAGPLPPGVDNGSGGITYTAHVGACTDSDATIDASAATTSGALADSPNNATYRLRIKATDVVGNSDLESAGTQPNGDCFGESKPDPVMSFVQGTSTTAGVNNNLTGVRDKATLGLNPWNDANTAIFSVSTTTSGTAPFSGALSNQRLRVTGNALAPNGGCIIAFVNPNCVFSPSNVTTLLVDNGTGLDGYWTGEFFAQDDAGNRSATITRPVVADRLPPNIDAVSVFGLGALPFGGAANFTSGVIDNVDLTIGGVMVGYGAGPQMLRYPPKTLNTLFGTQKLTSPIVDGPSVLLRSISAGNILTAAQAWAIDAGENFATGSLTPISGALVPAGNGAAAFANVASLTVANSSNANLSRDGLTSNTATTRTFTATLTLSAGNLNPCGIVQFFWVDPTGVWRYIGNAVTVTNPAAGTWTFAMTWNPSTTDLPEDIDQIRFAPLVGGGNVAVCVDNASLPATGRYDGFASAPSTAYNIVR